MLARRVQVRHLLVSMLCRVRSECMWFLFCVLHDLSLVPGTIYAAFPLANPTPIGGRMPSVASGPCGVSVSFIRVNLSWFNVPFELFGRWLCVRVAIPPSKIECWFCRVVSVYCIGCWHCRSHQESAIVSPGLFGPVWP
jgi:hypothetical protein